MTRRKVSVERSSFLASRLEIVGPPNWLTPKEMMDDTSDMMDLESMYYWMVKRLAAGR
jgi:hypothetical protein